MSNTSNKQEADRLKKRVKSTRENIPQREIEEKLTTARIGLLIKQPFFGNMATRLKLVKADDWCETAATDGRNFFYNTRFIDGLTARKCEWLFGHEVLHNVFEHLLRRGDRHPLLSNIAMDYAVNLILKDEKIGDQIEDTLYDEQYKGMAWEEIYDLLLKEAPHCPVHNPNGQQSGDGSGSDGSGDGSSESDDSKSGQSPGSGQKPGKGKGSCSGQCTCTGKRKLTLDEMADKLVDHHLDGAGKDGQPKVTEAERQQIRDEIKEAMIASAQAAGNVPAGIKRLISELTEPKMNWREILRQQIQSTIKTDFSFISPNKKAMSSGFVIPGMKRDEALDICVAIDMSGSIGQKEANMMISEVAGIMQQYDDYSIHIWCFDTKVYNAEVFRSDEGADVSTYQVTGGGGTSFQCNWEFMKDEDIQPKMLIMLTDGYTGDGWGDESYCDTIFCIIPNGMKEEAPHGTTIQLED